MNENDPTASLTSRAIRSFVIRNGRMTDGQREAIATLMPVYGVAFCEAKLDFATLFGNDSPVWLEVGFGNGEALLHIAARFPEINFLGIEVHAPGVGHLLAGIESQALSNIRVMRHDAVDVLQHMIPADSLARVLVFFPDPWHKKRHHKRRILQGETITLIEKTLKIDGVLHCATDWEPYAEAMLEELGASTLLVNQSSDGFSEKPEYRPLTRFEKRGLKLGHVVRDLLYTRVDA
ncbi:MAG: tRNA (guanosine(46)-N7)-methyltransferase TrmB [Granulosicoccus sp.]|nr:tRNA (guanosine(46)-N7)-methyltransferase TrmB [Granulosicoccus sp.]